MELFLPQQIALNETSQAVIAEVEETARRVDEYRPLPPAVSKRIEDSLLGERVFGSNAIEGNTLDLRETVSVLQTGRILENKKRDAIEARNLGEAVNRVSTLRTEGPAAHTVDRLLEVHKLILRETPDEYWGGRFREQRVLIEAAKHQPPDHLIVPTLVSRVLEQLRNPSDIPGLVVATWAHWALARIHPFKDGNGRLSRLWQDLVLFQRNLTCAIITPELRRDYLDALALADEGDFNSLLQLVAQQVDGVLQKYLIELTADKELDQFAKEIAGEVDARLAQKKQLRFQKWWWRFKQLRTEFENVANKITSQEGRVRIQLQPYDTLDQANWERIAETGKTSHTWFFKLDFDSGAKHLQYVFVFLKHNTTSCDTQVERSENRVGLFIDESAGPGKKRNLDKIADCPITLREIFLVGDAFVIRRFDRATQQAIYERHVSAREIAKDFIREVVDRRLI